jgi:hypothetical protein
MPSGGSRTGDLDSLIYKSFYIKELVENNFWIYNYCDYKKNENI